MFRRLKWFKPLSDLDLAVISLAQCLYVRGLNTFNEMSEFGQEYWIDKYGEELPELVNKELNKGKNNKKWIKATKYASSLYKSN